MHARPRRLAVMPPRRQVLGAALAVLGAPALARASPGWAPGRPIVITVPYAAGGSADALARPLADRLAPLLGVAVVIENRPGAQTAIGAEAVARAAPDGHRLLLTATATITVNPLLSRSLPYRVEDFAAVAHLATLPYALAARQGAPDTAEAFVAHARAHPGRVSIGTLGPGSSLHLAGARIAMELGLVWTEVTYRSDVLALNDLVAGRIDAAMLGGPAAMVGERSGRARILGWTAAARLPSLPDHPVLAEHWPDLVVTGWIGLHAPARTPPEAVARINAACAEALRQDDVLRERLAGEGLFLVEPGPPAAFQAYLDGEARRIEPVLRRLGLLPA